MARLGATSNPSLVSWRTLMLSIEAVFDFEIIELQPFDLG